MITREEQQTKAQQARQGNCISIAMPIQVFGTEITGQDFMEMTQTQVLCREGAAIISTHRLAPMQQIMVRNLATGAEAQARIIGEMSARPNSRVYGIALVDPEFKLWNINFPSPDDDQTRSERWIVLIIGTVVSFIVAWGVVEWFLHWVRKHGFTMFAIYRILLGGALLIWGAKWIGS